MLCGKKLIKRFNENFHLFIYGFSSCFRNDFHIMYKKAIKRGEFLNENQDEINEIGKELTLFNHKEHKYLHKVHKETLTKY